ncbi:MAG TPA: tripartite tricarboxylate transporter TctB family protein [Thermodesulfobacteriota bacterium]
MSARLVIAAAVVGLGLLVGAGAANFRAIGAAPGAGPAIFPALVAIGLVVSGILVGLEAWREARGRAAAAGDVAAQAGPAAFDWRGFLLVAAGLAAFVALVERAGFVLAASALFVLVARGFGSRRPVRSAAIGVVLAAVVYVVFTRGLGLPLPAGILEGVLAAPPR